MPVMADDSSSSSSGKYLKEVYIAYQKTEEEAVQWLKDNGWEPIVGNNGFNAGKASFFDNNAAADQNVAAAMGIRRTDDPKEAVTDMAIMNMKGGYSFPAYEKLIEQKQDEIDETINAYMPVINEFRENYQGKGSRATCSRYISRPPAMWSSLWSRCLL